MLKIENASVKRIFRVTFSEKKKKNYQAEYTQM